MISHLSLDIPFKYFRSSARAESACSDVSSKFPPILSSCSCCIATMEESFLNMDCISVMWLSIFLTASALWTIRLSSVCNIGISIATSSGISVTSLSIYGLKFLGGGPVRRSPIIFRLRSSSAFKFCVRICKASLSPFVVIRRSLLREWMTVTEWSDDCLLPPLRVTIRSNCSISVLITLISCAIVAVKLLIFSVGSPKGDWDLASSVSSLSLEAVTDVFLPISEARLLTEIVCAMASFLVFFFSTGISSIFL